MASGSRRVVIPVRPSALAPLETARLVVRGVAAEDAARLAHYVARNAEHHGPWDPPRPPDYHAQAHWRRRLRAELEDAQAGRSFMWLWTRRDGDDGAIVGTCRFGNVQRGPA